MLKKSFEHLSLKALFIWNFDESVISILPEGDVPYSGFEDQASHRMELFLQRLMNLFVECMKRIHFLWVPVTEMDTHQSVENIRTSITLLKGGIDGLSAVRRETMFINVLEGLHPLEAEILCSGQG